MRRVKRTLGRLLRKLRISDWIGLVNLMTRLVERACEFLGND
jgi:hypothetical protein